VCVYECDKKKRREDVQRVKEKEGRKGKKSRAT
jgi:hypothetical protein